jgi:hypothetical protein
MAVIRSLFTKVRFASKSNFYNSRIGAGSRISGKRIFQMELISSYLVTDEEERSPFHLIQNLIKERATLEYYFLKSSNNFEALFEEYHTSLAGIQN